MINTKIALLIFIVLFISGGTICYVWHVQPLTENVSGLQAETKISSDLIPIQKGIDDWYYWKGSQHNNSSLTKGIKTNWSKKLKVVWKIDYLCQGKKSETWSIPVIQGNHLVVPGYSNNHDVLFCLHSQTGKLLWKNAYMAKSAARFGAGSRATPYIDGQYVYTFGKVGDIVCWNLYDGKKIWHKNVIKNGGISPKWGFSSAPLVYKNMVIVQGKGAYGIAFDKLTGEIIWQSEKDGKSGYAAPVIAKFYGKDQLLIYHGNGIAGVNPLTGKELWDIEWKTKHGVNASTPYVFGNIVFITSNYGMGCQAIEVTQNGAKSLWKNNAIESHHSDPIIIDGYIYCYSGRSSSNRGKFKCLELKTGREIWSTKSIGNGTTIYVDGYLICLDYKGNIFLVKPNPKKFQKITEIKGIIPNVSINKSWTMPIVSNGKLYIRYLKSLVCYELK